MLSLSVTGSRGFRLLMGCGVAVAVISTVVLILMLIRNQRMIKTAARDIEFMKMQADSAARYSDQQQPTFVEMEEVSTISRGQKYDKLPLDP